MECVSHSRPLLSYEMIISLENFYCFFVRVELAVPCLPDFLALTGPRFFLNSRMCCMDERMEASIISSGCEQRISCRESYLNFTFHGMWISQLLKDVAIITLK